MSNSRRDEGRILRRNAPDWQRRHPSKTGWKLSPPIPGAAVHSDLYVAKIGLVLPRDVADRVGMISPGWAVHLNKGWGVFKSKKEALARTGDNNLVFYHDGEDMHAFVQSYAEYYNFHQVDKLPPNSIRRQRSRRM